VVEEAGDGSGDVQPIGRVGVGDIEDALSGCVCDGLDQRGDVDGRAGMVDPRTSVGEQDGFAPVQLMRLFEGICRNSLNGLRLAGRSSG